MKERRKAAKDGGDPMKEMRERYTRAVEADQDNRNLGLEDFRFVTVPGYQWDEQQKKKRKGRPCYEFPLLRSHWRQITGDQKQARPQIKIRAVEDGDAKGAELRQGIIRNIEDQSHAGSAYDTGFEWSSAAGFGAWRVVTEYSDDDAWDQDIRIKEIPDALSTVWFDPAAKERDLRDAMYAFVEESISRDLFKERYPNADPIDFESQNKTNYGDWCGQDTVRIAEYWRKEPVTRTICLLSDGRSVDGEQCKAEAEALAAQGITVVRERTVKTHKVVMSIVSGAEEIDGPHDWPGKRIPIIPVFGDRYYIEGKWVWSGLVRHAKDAARLVNYNITTGQEILAKQHKSTPLVTPKMLEGDGVKRLWDSSNSVDLPYLPYTPDPLVQGNKPDYMAAPPIHAAFANFGQMSIDLLKSSTGIHDASLGERSNETSGKAIIARQREGDTATFSYQDGLAFSIQSTGEIVLDLIPHIYDTPRMVRVLGKDGGEDWQEINKPLPDGTVLNDLSAGKYDVSVSTGPSFSTQRAEFADLMLNMAQGNPELMQVAGDLVMGSLDFPKAEEVAERLKLMLPPPVQQAIAADKKLPPEVMQAMQHVEQQGQQLQQAMGELQQQAMQLEQEKASVTADKGAIAAQLKELAAKQQIMAAEYDQKRTELENMQLRWELTQAKKLSDPVKPDNLDEAA